MSSSELGRLVPPRPSHLLSVAVGGAAVLALALTACGSSATPVSSPASVTATSSGTASSSTASSSGATVRVASTSLGTVVVDTAGRTLYMFTKDTQDSGKSVCAGPCATAWPPYTTTATPTADGVSGTLGTLTTPGGAKQVTLGGWPLYYFDKDKVTGDVHGQNVNKVWFVLDANGTPLKAAAG